MQSKPSVNNPTSSWRRNSKFKWLILFASAIFLIIVAITTAFLSRTLFEKPIADAVCEMTLQSINCNYQSNLFTPVFYIVLLTGALLLTLLSQEKIKKSYILFFLIPFVFILLFNLNGINFLVTSSDTIYYGNPIAPFSVAKIKISEISSIESKIVRSVSINTATKSTNNYCDEEITIVVQGKGTNIGAVYSPEILRKLQDSGKEIKITKQTPCEYYSPSLY